MAAKLGLQPEFLAGDWRTRRRSGRRSKRACARTRRTRIKAVCVVHNETSTGVTSRIARGAQGDRRGEASGAAPGGHHLLARLDRLPARRMGRGRHRRRLAEGPDAAAGPVLQRDLATRRSPPPSPRSCRAAYWDWERDDRQQQGRLFPVHARHQPALRPARSAEDAARRGRPGQRLRAPPAPRRGDAARGARLGAGSAGDESRGILAARSPRCCCRPGTTPTACAR